MDIEVLSKEIGTFVEKVSKMDVDLDLLKRIVNSTGIDKLPQEVSKRLSEAMDKALEQTKGDVLTNLENLKKQFLRQTSNPAGAPDGAKSPKPKGEPKEKILMEQFHEHLSTEWDIITNKSGKQTVANRLLHGTGLALVGYGIYWLGKAVYGLGKRVVGFVIPSKSDSFIMKTLKYVGLATGATYILKKFGFMGEAKAGEKAAPSKLTKMPPAGTNLMQATAFEYEGKPLEIQCFADGIQIGGTRYSVKPDTMLQTLYATTSLGSTIDKVELKSAQWNGASITADIDIHFTKLDVNPFDNTPPTKGVDSKTGKQYKVPTDAMNTILQNAVNGTKSFTVKGVVFTAS